MPNIVITVIIVAVAIVLVVFFISFLFKDEPVPLYEEDDSNPNTPPVPIMYDHDDDPSTPDIQQTETKLSIFSYVILKFGDCVEQKDWSPNPFRVFGRPPSVYRCFKSIVGVFSE